MNFASCLLWTLGWLLCSIITLMEIIARDRRLDPNQEIYIDHDEWCAVALGPLCCLIVFVYRALCWLAAGLQWCAVSALKLIGRF